MKGDWCYWVNCFTSQQCDDIINSAMKLPVQTPTLGYDSALTDNNMRRSYVRWIDDTNKDFDYLFHLMWKYMRIINNDWFGYHVTHLPPMQFTEYDASYKGEYKSHQDIFWVNPTDRHRKVSLILQLTDPAEYDGGDLNIQSNVANPPEADRQAMRQRGTIIAFPSFTWHALEPVTRGRRHSLVAWFEGPKFT